VWAEIKEINPFYASYMYDNQKPNLLNGNDYIFAKNGKGEKGAV